MDALCFDIKAPFATFRIPSTTRGYLTFPFPPRTTILGLIGSVLGIPRNRLYLQDHFLYDSNIAIQLINSPSTINFRTNQIQTHSILTIEKQFKIFIPGDLERGVRSPQNLVLLKDVKYRIYLNLSSNNQAKFDVLKARLKGRRYIYPPFLGRANFLASIDYIDHIELTKLKTINTTIKISTICATKDIAEIEPGNFTIITNVPISYNATIDRTKGILLKPGVLVDIIYFTESIKIRPKTEIYEITKTKIQALKNMKLCFLPSN